MTSSAKSHATLSGARCLSPRERPIRCGVAIAAWTLSIVACLTLTEAAADAREGPRLFAQPILREKEQWVLVSVLGARKTGALVSARFSFASSEAPPEDRDLWM